MATPVEGNEGIHDVVDESSVELDETFPELGIVQMMLVGDYYDKLDHGVGHVA